jgi:2-polyprenyl-3-methyl-5-hydroxy-6-metoxy-1,4-benzoquinol methylase
MKSVVASEPKRGTSLEGESPSESHSACRVCGSDNAKVWLRAPDRFHGRHEKYTLLRCMACSLVWLSNPPAPSEMNQHYTDAYDRLISAAGQDAPHRWRARNATLSAYKNSGELLDLGCSSGSFLTSRKGQGWKLHGIEMSATCAKVAQTNSGAQVFVGDILDAPFPAGSFDVITCFDVLEHLYTPRRVLSRVSEWLKPGGIFYVLVPNIDSAEGRAFGSYWHGLELPRHLFHYSPTSLRFLAKSVGLQEIFVETHRNPAVGTSLRYVWDDVFGAVGVQRTPVAYRSEPGLAWRAGRKLIRMTILRALLAMAPLVGGGESIHAVFQKSGSSD